jgi:hypothetical protein
MIEFLSSSTFNLPDNMKSKKMKTFILVIASVFISCTSIKTSRYAKFNQFHYDKEQPCFNFKNDSLKINGAWYWASDSRAIPEIS